MANYSDIRIGLSTTIGSFLSWLIRFFTKGEYSHAWISYPSILWGGRWMAHSDEHGVRKIPAEPYLTKKKVSYVEYRCKVELSKDLEKCREFIGRKYDFLSLLIGFPIKLLIYWVSGKRICNPACDESKFTCSEFVAKVLKIAELPGTDQWDPESITPKDLRKYCDQHPELFDRL